MEVNDEVEQAFRQGVEFGKNEARKTAVWRRKCFVNAHCCYDCPNFESQIADERYGYGIAEDMGLEEIECKDCYYNSGECKDCLLEHSSDCPEYRREDK